MADKKVAKVTLNGQTLIDISEDSVNEDNLYTNETAHGADGEPVLGRASGGGGDTSDCYKTTDPVSTDLDDADYIPFNDVSDSEEPKKKTLFSNFKEKLKALFSFISTQNNGEQMVWHAKLGNFWAQIKLNKTQGKLRFNWSSDGGTTWHGDVIVQNELTFDNTPTANSDNPVKSGGIFSFFGNYFNLSKNNNISIAANTDLNTIVTPGTYITGSAVITQSLSHCPVSVAFKMIVIMRDNNNEVVQEIVEQNETDTMPWIRTRNNSLQWGDWHRYVEKDAVHYLKYPSLANQIPANADLNDYTVAGTFQCNNSSIAVTLLNCPAVNSFKLIVDRQYSSAESEIQQTICLQNADNRTNWHRTKTYNSTWGGWIQDVGSFAKTYTLDGNDYDGIEFFAVAANGCRGTISFNRTLSKRLMYDFYDGTSYQGSKEIANILDLRPTMAIQGKNLLAWRGRSNVITHNGITFTFNPANGEITVNGTASNSDAILTLWYYTDNMRLPSGTWILSGCPSGGSSSKYGLRLLVGGLDKYDYGSGNEFYTDERVGTSSAGTCYFFVKSGQTVSNLILKPMLRPNWTSATYEPSEGHHKGCNYVGTCETAAATKDKEAYVDGYFVLRTGVRVAIKFYNTNTYSSATANPVTLNVNGTGAKNIWYNTTHSGAGNTGTSPGVYGTAGRYIYYIYDGIYWVWDGHGADNNSTNFLRNDAPSTMTCATPYLYLKASNVDTKQSNNGVSSTVYPTFSISDKNGYIITRMESVVETNGNITNKLYAQNFNSSGEQASFISINLRAKKDGTSEYVFSDPHKLNRNTGFGYEVCNTAAATAAKVVTMTNYKLVANSYVSIRFANDVPANATLNINSQGAKSIYYRNAAITAGIIRAGDTVTFIYDGTYYRVVANDKWGG